MGKPLNNSVIEQRIFRAIDKIYETALDPAQLTDLLRAIGALVGAPQGSLMLCSFSQKTMTDYGYGRNEELISLFNTRFIGEDPWFEPIALLGAGVVATGQELRPTKNFEHTAVYQECMKLDEVYDCLGVMLESGRDLNAVVAFQRPEFLPLFNGEEKRILGVLVPHLQRLIQIHRKFDSLSVAAALQIEALDRLNFGVVIVKMTGGIQFANVSARETESARDGLRFSSYGLVADHPQDSDALAEAQRRALRLQSANSLGARGGTIAVRRPSLKRPYTVHVMLLNDHVLSSARTIGSAEPACLITITDPASAPLPRVDLLMQAYGLTPTESALALRVGEGASLKEAADQLSISEQTARWHLKNVLAKTETSRQSELVGMLMRMASPLRPKPS